MTGEIEKLMDPIPTSTTEPLPKPGGSSRGYSNIPSTQSKLRMGSCNEDYFAWLDAIDDISLASNIDVSLLQHKDKNTSKLKVKSALKIARRIHSDTMHESVKGNLTFQGDIFQIERDLSQLFSFNED